MLSLEKQCGLRAQTGTMDQIWLLCQVIQKTVEHKTSLHICFVNLSEAFGSVSGLL